MNLTFNPAQIGDLPTIVEIYNSTIASRMVTADIEPVSVESRLEWFNRHNEYRPLMLVKNIDQNVIGWVSFEPFYGRPAYNGTAELSIYLHESLRGKGYGKMILQHCISISASLGITTLLGFIFQHNQPSLKLFYDAGFTDWGILPNIALLDSVERTLVIVGLRVR